MIDFKYARPEVDVWAMAASLYNMLTGAVPRDFPAGRDPWLGGAGDAGRSHPTAEVFAAEELAEVIDRALVEEPEIPFKTAAAFKEALETAL